MVSRFHDGWPHVIWKWNKRVCAWEYGIRVARKKYRSVLGEDGGVNGDRGSHVCCLWEVPAWRV